MKKINEIDVKHLKMIRDNVNQLLYNASLIHDSEKNLILDVAPQVYEGAKKFFKKAKIQTLDINKESNADYICDLARTKFISDNTFDVIFCTEVLEHTNDPFSCVKSMHRILKSGGTCYVTTPFNFRIHNPLPDNWRFTEHGLKILFKQFKNLEISTLEDEGRFLMPIQYALIAEK